MTIPEIEESAAKAMNRTKGSRPMKAEKKPHRENPRRGDVAFVNAYCGSRFGRPLVVGTFRVNRAGHALLLCTKRSLPPPAGPVGTGQGAPRKGPRNRQPKYYYEQVTPLKHMHSCARGWAAVKAAIQAGSTGEILRTELAK